MCRATHAVLEMLSIQQDRLTDQQVAQLRDVSDVVTWCDYVYATLTRGSRNCLPQRKWMKVVSRYYVDILNESASDDARDARQQIHRDLVEQTALKLGVEESIVRKTFAERAVPQGDEELGISAIMARIPFSIERRLVTAQGRSAFVSLALRYHAPLLTEGLFLSMPSAMYKVLLESSELPVLEGYASPLNHNMPEYCSLFDEDAEYGALQSFEQLLPHLSTPVRLCLNPPYTPRAIEKCVDLVIDYMERTRGEFVMLLADMHNFEPLDRIMSYRNTCSCLLQEGEYTVHSFFTERSICPPMTLRLIVNVRNSKQRSLICSRICDRFFAAASSTPGRQAT